MMRWDSDGYKYDYDLFDRTTEKQLYAFYGVLIPVDNENVGNELIFEIGQAIEDYSAGGYACAALPLVADKESFFRGIEQALKAQS